MKIVFHLLIDHIISQNIKIFFLKSQIIYLGYIINSDEVQAYRSKILAMMN